LKFLARKRKLKTEIMNTTENNKVIAEFMGMKPINKNESNGIWNCTIKAHGFNIVQHLSFHSDWNWLMEVVEKIERVGKTEFKFSVEFEKVKLSSNIESVYNACIEFIKWYNENKI
jgi:hypothetical protein